MPSPPQSYLTVAFSEDEHERERRRFERPRSPFGIGRLRTKESATELVIEKMLDSDDHSSTGSSEESDGAPEALTQRQVSPRDTGFFQRQRVEIWLLLTHPEASATGRFIETTIVCMIVFSTVCAIWETMPEARVYHTEFTCTEAVFTAIFSLEMALRFWVCDSTFRYLSSGYNLVDILATIPGYFIVTLELLHHMRENASEKATTLRFLDVASSAQALRIVRMVRLMRVLRFAKVARHSEPIQILVTTMKFSANALFLLVFIVFTAMLFAATVEYFIESEIGGSQFTSIPSASWWAAATVSTVGYGDFVPHTPLGKLWCAISIFGSLVIISICVAVLTSRFNEQHQLFRTKRHADKAMRRAASKATQAERLKRAARRGYIGPMSMCCDAQNVPLASCSAEVVVPGSPTHSMFMSRGAMPWADESSLKMRSQVKRFTSTKQGFEQANLKDKLDQIRRELESLTQDATAVITSREQQRAGRAKVEGEKETHYAMCALKLLALAGKTWVDQADHFTQEVLVRELDSQGLCALLGPKPVEPPQEPEFRVPHVVRRKSKRRTKRTPTNLQLGSDDALPYSFGCSSRGESLRGCSRDIGDLLICPTDRGVDHSM